MLFRLSGSALFLINVLLTWMGDRLWAGKPSHYVTSHLGQLSLLFLRGRLIQYQSFWLGLGVAGDTVWAVMACYVVEPLALTFRQNQFSAAENWWVSTWLWTTIVDCWKLSGTEEAVRSRQLMLCWHVGGQWVWCVCLCVVQVAECKWENR